MVQTDFGTCMHIERPPERSTQLRGVQLRLDADEMLSPSQSVQRRGEGLGSCYVGR